MRVRTSVERDCSATLPPKHAKAESNPEDLVLVLINATSPLHAHLLEELQPLYQQKSNVLVTSLKELVLDATVTLIAQREAYATPHLPPVKMPMLRDNHVQSLPLTAATDKELAHQDLTLACAVVDLLDQPRVNATLELSLEVLLMILCPSTNA